MHNLFDKNSYFNGDGIIILADNSQVNKLKKKKNSDNLFYIILEAFNTVGSFNMELLTH